MTTSVAAARLRASGDRHGALRRLGVLGARRQQDRPAAVASRNARPGRTPGQLRPPRPPSGRGAQGDRPAAVWRSAMDRTRRGARRWEADLFDALNGLSGWLVVVLWAPMQLGSLFGPVLVALVSWIAWRRWRPRWGWWGSLAARQGHQGPAPRRSPIDLMPEYVARWGTPTEAWASRAAAPWPSALATVLSPYLRRPWRWAAYGVAVLVALSRIHLAAHFPLDTVGGAALGYLLGWLYHLAGADGRRPPRFRRPLATLIVNSPPGRQVVTGAGQLAGGREAHAREHRAPT